MTLSTVVLDKHGYEICPECGTAIVEGWHMVWSAYCSMDDIKRMKSCPLYKVRLMPQSIGSDSAMALSLSEVKP